LQDAAHSFGGAHHGQRPGRFGVGATLSFHVAKVATTIEGGALATDDPALAAAARSIRNQGEAPDRKYRFTRIGANYRMTDLHAAIGVAQLAKLERLLAARRAVIGWYRTVLADAPGLLLPEEPPGCEHAWFLFSVRFATRALRDRAEALLAEAGVETRICWPYPVHLQPAYVGRLPARSRPCSERAAETVLSLPLHAGLGRGDVELIGATVRRALVEPGG
jgi:perosamine synthetase